MTRSRILLIAIAVLTGAALFFSGMAAGKNQVNMPKTVIHHVTLKWKADVKDADKQKALDGIKDICADIPGVKNIWMKTIKIQPKDYSQTFVIEFENEEALKAYADHPKKKEWNDLYYSIRETSMNSVTSN